MEGQGSKIERSSKLIKGFMALVIVMQIIEFYQTSIMDFGVIAGAFGALSFLRGLLLSPQLLVTPLKQWFKSNIKLSKESYKYFILAVVLIVISAI